MRSDFGLFESAKSQRQFFIVIQSKLVIMSFVPGKNVPHAFDARENGASEYFRHCGGSVLHALHLTALSIVALIAFTSLTRFAIASSVAVSTEEQYDT